jgi:hypothetical protein
MGETVRQIGSRKARIPSFFIVLLELDVRFKELLESWQQGAAGTRTAAEYAVRLPIDDAARLHALAELFPGRTREQIITELLSAALQEVTGSIPYVPGKKVISRDDQGDPVYEDAGLSPRLAQLTRKHRKELEAQAAKG